MKIFLIIVEIVKKFFLIIRSIIYFVLLFINYY